MKSFSESFPWINFRLDLTKASPHFWMLLGEAQSKCEHISGVPLRPSTAEELHQIYLAKGVLATTAIEGNTLSLDEVKKRIAGKLELPPSKEYLGQEIDNIVTACNAIASLINDVDIFSIKKESIKKYNQYVLSKLPLDQEIVPGQIRTHEVGVGRYKAPPANECERLLERLCHFLNNDFESINIGSIAGGIMKAIMAHLYLAWIHPFGDGNGRTARLVEYQILLASGISTPAAHLLSNHYNITRHEYYRQLDISSKSGGDVIPFLEYALQGFIDGLQEQLNIIRDQQWDIVWRNYIHEKFKDNARATGVRRRRLALDLSLNRKRIAIPKIRQISPRVAEAYAGKSIVALRRDIAELEQMGLVDKTADGVRARREIILSFLPRRVDKKTKNKQ